MKRAPHCMRRAMQAIDRIGGAEGDRTLDLRIANALRKVTQVAESAQRRATKIDLHSGAPFAASLEFWRF